MMSMHVSRRAFLQGLSFVPAFSLSRSGTQAEYVGSDNSIDVFKMRGGRRIQVQNVASRHPSFVKLDSSGRLLFAVNEIAEFQGLPAGSVESYSVQAGSGHLSLISRQCLSLSATTPRHFAISPDRRYLVVAAYGGGAYNVLPILRSGELGSATQIVKEIGSGPDSCRQSSAHPHSVLFHPGGKFLIGTDAGSDRVNVFAFLDGRMTRAHRIETKPGSGPGGLTMNVDGSLLLVAHELRPLFSCYRFDPESGHIQYISSWTGNGCDSRGSIDLGCKRRG